MGRWEIPNNWEWVKVGEIANVIGGGTPSTRIPQYFSEDTGIAWLTPADLSGYDGTYIKRGKRNITQAGYDSSSAVLLPPGTVLYTSRAPIGYCVIAENEIATNQGFKSFLLLGQTVSEYIRYYLVSSKEYAESFASGTTFKELSGSRIKELLIPFPPLNEQKRVSQKIKALQSRSTKVRKALEAIPPLMEKFRRSILSSAFRGDLTADWRAQNPDIEPVEKLMERIRKERRKRWEQAELAKMKAKGKTPKDDKWKNKYKEPEPVDITDLPELPEGWCWGPLEILGIHQSGIAYKSKDFTNSGIQVIKLGNLYQRRFDLSRDPTFLPQDHPAIFEGLLRPGDLIISQTGTRFKRDYGNFVIIPDDSGKLVLNQRLLRVRLVESSLAKWVLYTTRLTFYRDYFFSRETGGVNQGNVGVEGVMRGPIPFAPYQEMKVIIRQLENITKYTENIETISKKEIKNLSQIDQSILAKAFRGELVPQDPNDEPAEQLLARIKLHASKMPKLRAMKSHSTKRD